VVRTFRLVGAMAAIGLTEDARALFEKALALRARHGVRAGHIDPATGETRSNFVQTCSMVGLIDSVILLSIPWDDAF
jgi:GH15 family glucan-1,4-alpha-glucosidase